MWYRHVILGCFENCLTETFSIFEVICRFWDMTETYKKEALNCIFFFKKDSDRSVNQLFRTFRGIQPGGSYLKTLPCSVLD